MFPLVSVTTSFVAEEDAMSDSRDNKDKINQENECNVSVSEMEELISPEGDLLKSMDRWSVYIFHDTSKFTCRG